MYAPMRLNERRPIPVYDARDAVLRVEPSALGKPPPSSPHLPGANTSLSFPRGEVHWVPWWTTSRSSKMSSALTFGVADCVSMLLQTQNMTLVPTCVRMGFVVVPPSTGKKVEPWNPLKISQNRFLGKVGFCDFPVGHRFSRRTEKIKVIHMHFLAIFEVRS